MGSEASLSLFAAEVVYPDDSGEFVVDMPIRSFQDFLGPGWEPRPMPTAGAGTRPPYVVYRLASKEPASAATFRGDGFRVETSDRPSAPVVLTLLERASEAVKSLMSPPQPSRLILSYLYATGTKRRSNASRLSRHQLLSGDAGSVLLTTSGGRRYWTSRSAAGRWHRRRRPAVRSVECTIFYELRGSATSEPTDVVEEAHRVHQVFLGLTWPSSRRAATADLRLMRDVTFEVKVREFETSAGDLPRIERPSVHSSPADLLSHLGSVGFSWDAVSRIIDVPVHRLNAWRRGDPAKVSEHDRLASMVDFVAELDDVLPSANAASWLMTPLAESYFNGVDVVESGHGQALMRYARGHLTAAELLDLAFPQWQGTLDDGFEVFTASDGKKAIHVCDSPGTR